MSRLSDKQGRLLEYNARYLNLSDAEEQALFRLPFVDMDTSDIMTLIDAVWGYMRAKTDGERFSWQNEIKCVIGAYKEQTKLID
jgi:hypothetical protein